MATSFFWNNDLFPVPGARVFDHTTQRIAAVSRAPGNLDLFVIGFDNHVWTTFWGPHQIDPSIKLRAIAPAGSGRFIEVTGIGFTPGQIAKISYDIQSGGGPTTHQTGEETVTSDGTGNFVHPIQVNLGGDISQAGVQATDVASGATASASI